MLGLWLDLMVSKAFSNLNDSMTLWYYSLHSYLFPPLILYSFTLSICFYLVPLQMLVVCDIKGVGYKRTLIWSLPVPGVTTMTLKTDTCCGMGQIMSVKRFMVQENHLGFFLLLVEEDWLDPSLYVEIQVTNIICLSSR